MEAILFAISSINMFAIPFGLIWVFAAMGINVYMVIWGLDNFDVTSFGLHGKTLILFKLVTYPVRMLEDFIAYIKGSN